MPNLFARKITGQPARQLFMTDINQFYQAETYQVESGVGALVDQLAQTIGRELDRRMLRLGITDAQSKPLLLLHQGGCVVAADLSRMVCHDTGALTRLIDRLEAKGLLQRRRSAEDRRVVNLALTEAGGMLATEVPGVRVVLANQVLAGFSADEFLQLKDLLSRALLNARALGGRNI